MIVILSAGAVAAYSLFWRSDNTAKAPCCPGASTACATPCGGDSTGTGAVIDWSFKVQGWDSAASPVDSPSGEEQKKTSSGDGVD